jgi:biopolymer transport protein ExbD
MKIKRKTSIQNLIPVSSMSDIAFLLLIFLMLSSILNMKQGPDIQLPRAQEISAPREVKKFDILIDRQGNIFFEGQYRLADEITRIFSARVGEFPDLYVQISSDRDTEYEKVDQVVKALQEAECYRLLFITDKEEGGI